MAAGLQRIGIVGGGAWGTALALAARQAGRDVLIWAREPDVVEDINRRHRNERFLPGITLEPAIAATGALAELGRCEAVLLVAPAQALRIVAAQLAPHLDRGVPAIICAKGIERDSGALMTEVAAETLPGRPLGVLSGPTFAAEVARGLPTAVTLAVADQALGEALANALGTAAFRPYWTDDPPGAALGGAVKNVLAIACGIAMGRALGDNARAALITRGFAELVRLGRALGARPETLFGLAGLGDLSLTCNGTQSRNLSLGIALGRGTPLAELLSGRDSVVEGVYTAAAVARRAAALGVEMPICGAVDAILNGGAAIDDTIAQVMARPFRAEAE